MAAVTVDWLRMTPYASAGTFDSRIFDAGAAAAWSTLSWNVTTPTGTSVALSYRTGNTATPDGTWTTFQPVAASGNALTGTSRYIQYRASLSTSNVDLTPSLDQVTIVYSLAPPNTAPGRGRRQLQHAAGHGPQRGGARRPR